MASLIKPLDATPPSVMLGAPVGVLGVLVFGVLLPPPPQAARVEVKAHARLKRVNFMLITKSFNQLAIVT
jgi:hypothetical protein